MPDELIAPQPVGIQGSAHPHVSARLAVLDVIGPKLPAGSLRVGGDSPDGLVLVGNAPAARIVDLFARVDDEDDLAAVPFHVARTVSAGDGTYTFSGLSAWAPGFDVCIRGRLAYGERDVWIPGVQAGSP